MTHRDRGGNLLELAELTAAGHSAPSAGPGRVSTLRAGAWEGGASAYPLPASRCWGVGPSGGLRHPGGKNRKDATVWGFNSQHGKKFEEVVQYFSCKGLLFYTEQKKKKQAGAQSTDRLRTSPEVGDPSAIAHVGFCLAFS